MGWVGGVGSRDAIVKCIVSSFKLDSIPLTKRGDILDPCYEI